MNKDLDCTRHRLAVSFGYCPALKALGDSLCVSFSLIRALMPFSTKSSNVIFLVMSSSSFGILPSATTLMSSSCLRLYARLAVHYSAPKYPGLLLATHQ